MSKLESDMARLDKKLHSSGRKTKGGWLGLPSPSKVVQKSISRHYGNSSLDRKIRNVSRRHPNRNLMVTINSRKDFKVEPE